MNRSKFRSTAAIFATTIASAVLATSPAHADRCDQLAKQLTEQIDGLKLGKTVAGVIYLQHPAVKQASLGCASRNASNQVFAATDDRKPKPEFFDFVATLAAQVFTITKQDTLRGVKRCYGRIGFVRGTNIVTRYRRLDISCTGARLGQKGGTTMTVSRDKDE